MIKDRDNKNLEQSHIDLRGNAVRFWIKMDRSPIFKPLLIALSFIYGLLVSSRKWAYKTGILSSKSLPLPVISVGNITVGGTGKTPVVGMIAGILLEKGYHPAILSRGYKRKGKERQIIVSDGKKILTHAEDVGDEPYMLAEWLPSIPVIVGADRYLSGYSATKEFGIDCIILDDGFQHLRLFRDIDILVINAREPFGREALLPAGRLREPISGIRRAGLILINKLRPDQDIGEIILKIRRYNNQSPILETIYLPESIAAIGDHTRDMPISSIVGKSVLAFAGIASPEGFFEQLKDVGARIKKTLIFDDHHWFSNDEIAMIKDAANASLADIIITTEKDSTRLPLEGSEGIFSLRMRMLIKGDLAVLDDILSPILVS